MSELIYDRVKELPLENNTPRRYLRPVVQPPVSHPHQEGDLVTVHPIGKDMGRFRGRQGVVVAVHDDDGIDVDVAGEVIGLGHHSVAAA